MPEDRSETLEIVRPESPKDPQPDTEETLEPPNNATSGTPDTRKGFAPSESVFVPKKKTKDSRQNTSADNGKLGGRPRGDGMPPGSVSTPTQVPRPKFTIFKSDSTNGSQRTRAFYNWWNDLPTWAREKTILYVYRDWPVLKALPEDSKDFAYIDKISGEEPLTDDLDLLNRYGCGRYKLMFNEQPGGNLCVAYAYSLGNDMKSYPPTDRRISDIENIDDSHPDNRSYIEFLKMRGIWKKEGEGEMATATVVDRVLDQNRELTDKVIKSAQQAQQTPPKNDGVSLDQAMRMGMEVVADASKRSNEIMQKTFEQARSIQDDRTPAVPSAPAVDPMQLAIQLVTLIQQGKSEGNKEVEMLRGQLAQLQQEQLRMMSDQLKTLTERLTSNTSPNATNPFSSIQEGMKAMREMKSVVDDISGNTGNDKGVVEEVAGAIGPAWLGKYAPLIQQGFSVVDSFFRYRAAMSGAPMPNMPPQQYPTSPQPSFPQNPQGYPQQQYAPPAPPAPGLSAPPLPAGFPPELANLLMRISRSLHYHLADINATGTDFASWFMSGEGDETYAEVRGFGAEGIVGALQAFPVTNQILVQFPAERVQMFVTEFVNPNFGPDDEDDAEGDSNVPSGADVVEPPKEPQLA